MRRITFSGIFLTLLLFGMLYTMLNVRFVTSWSNGGFSVDPENPNYGTHDWIGEHALDWLPTKEKQFILDNLAAYLYGTELPDNPEGIGDTTKHHIYYWSNGSLQDDVSAVRASEEFNNALNFIELTDFTNASKTVGVMSHYIADVAVFGHVMGGGTEWGAETHHSDYESYVNERTSSYDAEFNVYLSFDGDLRVISAYDAAKKLAYDTTFDVDGTLTCVWMDQNYDWNNPTFKNRCGESLNLAVNYLTDVLHTLYLEVYPPVHNVNTNLNYTTIQAAINAPETLDGHTILVDAGTYYECVDIHKSISLIGENRKTTIIDGSETGSVVTLTANNTMISEFTVRESGKPALEYTPSTDTGILVFAGYGQVVENATIIDNDIKDNYAGVFIWYSLGNTVINNKIENNSIGIGIDETIHNNICRNIVSTNTGGIWLGSGGNNVSSNIISSNWAYGVQLDGSFSNTVDGNVIEYNGYGIELQGSSNNITGNTIRNNGFPISLGGSEDNFIYHNNFMDNTEQVETGLGYYNFWDDGYPSGGNYWSDHNPPDIYSGPYQNETGGDKIGDTPYVMDGGNIDRYPLIYPYGRVSSADLNDDGIVDIFDAIRLGGAFGSEPGDVCMPCWDPKADINQDGIVDIYDAIILAIHFGEEG